MDTEAPELLIDFMKRQLQIRQTTMSYMIELYRDSDKLDLLSAEYNQLSLYFSEATRELVLAKINSLHEVLYKQDQTILEFISKIKVVGE